MRNGVCFKSKVNFAEFGHCYEENITAVSVSLKKIN